MKIFPSLSEKEYSVLAFKRGLTTKLHLCCTSEKYAFVFHLSAGNRHDAPQGRKLIETIYSEDDHDLLMDRAYEDNKTRALAEEHGFHVVVPPKKNRKDPWEYDKELYKKRNRIHNLIFFSIDKNRNYLFCIVLYFSQTDLIYIIL